MSLPYHVTGLLRHKYLGYCYKGTCPKIHNCQAFLGALQMQYVSVLSPRLLLPAGKDGLVTKGFVFSCHQLFISAKQAARAIFLPALLWVLQSKNLMSVKTALTLAKLCACNSNADMYVLLPCFTLMQVISHRSRGKHRYDGRPGFDVS